ncbi:MAG: hypothetical protein H7Y11_07565 [Armatimonadetes bacterium]|nr:hypothetical protein [Anaerolineae bacterium]
MITPNLTQVVVWVHGDCLSPENPALLAHPGAPAIYVWDDALLTQWRVSLKRVVFIYECLLELPVVIRRGDVAQEVAAFAAEHSAGRIITSDSSSPRFRQTAKQISTQMPSGSRLEVLKSEPFVEYNGHIDLKRFSRYWNAVKKAAFK